jgi:phosphoglycerol transferase MdoB-like AlkP superfamily enzyme
MLLLQINAIADVLNSSEWLFPIAECFHITAFAWSIGLIAAVDYRLLGFGIQHSTPSEVLRDTAPWTLLGLAVVLLSGPLLFLSDARMYLHNPSFVFKMYALAAAILFNYTIHRQVAKSDSSSQAVRVVTAVVSLLLWISVVFGGLFIAFA